MGKMGGQRGLYVLLGSNSRKSHHNPTAPTLMPGALKQRGVGSCTPDRGCSCAENSKGGGTGPQFRAQAASSPPPPRRSQKSRTRVTLPAHHTLLLPRWANLGRSRTHASTGLTEMCPSETQRVAPEHSSWLQGVGGTGREKQGDSCH